MKELWHVIATDTAQRPLYSAAVSVESDDVTVSGPVAALQVAWDRLLVGGYDPTKVMIWNLSRRDSPQVNG